jgi:heme exporter protein A
MLQAIGLECVRGECCLFSGVSLALERGTLLHVQGANGSGKTSLLRILAGLALPEAGRIEWDGQPVRALGDAFRAALAYVGHANAIKDDLSAVENLLVSERLAGGDIDEARARAALAALGLAAHADLPTRVLSQGQKRRAALARLAFRGHAPLWILDEPFAALDAPAVTKLGEMVSAHLGAGGIVVLTTHQAVEVAAPRTLTTTL